VQIFVISLRTALDRREYVATQFRNAGLPFRFFDAIEGSRALEQYADAIDRRSYRLNTYRDPLPGEIGCYASHLALWKQAAATREPMIVLEDDCEIATNFPDALRVVEDEIERFGFIRLQSFKRRLSLKFLPASHVVAEFSGFEMHYLSDVPLALLAYAVSPASAAKLVAASETIAAPVDKFMQRTWANDVPVFALSPVSVKASAFCRQTTIGRRRRRKKTRVGIALRRAAYKLRGELERRRFDNEQLSLLRNDNLSDQ
jgi:glycosyl transferase family 25